jgi:hypothetical protein
MLAAITRPACESRPPTLPGVIMPDPLNIPVPQRFSRFVARADDTGVAGLKIHVHPTKAPRNLAIHRSIPRRCDLFSTHPEVFPLFTQALGPEAG